MHMYRHMYIPRRMPNLRFERKWSWMESAWSPHRRSDRRLPPPQQHANGDGYYAMVERMVTSDEDAGHDGVAAEEEAAARVD